MPKEKQTLYVANYTLPELEENLRGNFCKVGIYFKGSPDKWDNPMSGGFMHPLHLLTQIAREVFKFHGKLYRGTFDNLFSWYAHGVLAEHIKEPVASSRFIAALRKAYFQDREAPERKLREYEEEMEQWQEQELAEQEKEKQNMA